MARQERVPVRKYPGIYKYTRYGKVAYGFVVDVGAGKRRQLTRQGFTSLDAADKARTALLHDRNTGEVIEPSRELLRDFFARWLEMRRPSIRERTLCAYRGDFGRADPFLGGMELRHIRADHVQACVSAMVEKDYAPQSIRKSIDLLRRLFTAAVRWGLLRRSPATYLDLPRLDEERREMLTAEQLAQLVKHSSSGPWGLVIRTLVETWMRAGELCDLRWGAVDFERGVIRVERSLSGTVDGGYTSLAGKTAAARRDITVSATLMRLLAQEKDRQRFTGHVTNETPVFRSATGKVLRPSNIATPVRLCCKRAGVPESSPHWIRHSGISAARLAGGDIVTISKRAGHKDIKTTLAIYSHTDAEQNRQLGEAFGALLDVG